MLKIFRRTELIATDAKAHKRIHTNTTNDVQRTYTNENEFCWSLIRQYTQVDVGRLSPMYEEADFRVYIFVRKWVLN